MVVTAVTCEGRLVATWRTVFTPELRAREPAAVEELLASQHLEVIEHAGLGAFDHALPTEKRPGKAAAARPVASPLEPAVAPPAPPAPPRPPEKAPIYSHPAFDGLPMLDGQYGEGELELALEAPAPAPPPERPPTLSPEPPLLELETPSPVSATPARELAEEGLQRPKRPSLPTAPVVTLDDLGKKPR